MSGFGTFSFQSKKEEETGISSYYNNKTTIIQEARVFNDSPISPRRCRALLTRIIYLLYVGDSLSTQEATSLFFGVTKLFQHKDVCPQLFGGPGRTVFVVVLIACTV
jgi:coatomer protein complex subunit gamma